MVSQLEKVSDKYINKNLSNTSNHVAYTNMAVIAREAVKAMDCNNIRSNLLHVMTRGH